MGELIPFIVLSDADDCLTRQISDKTEAIQNSGHLVVLTYVSSSVP
jgi:hypothetical protein